MSTHLEDLPNELFFDMFSTYFDGVQLYKSFVGLNFRFNSILKSLKNIYLRLEHSNDDKSLNFFSKQVISLYIDSKHKSINFVQFVVNIRSLTLVDPTILQIMNLLEISEHLEHISILWLNPHSINLISVRAFYELIFCASSCESLRSCRLYLPESHSLYLEPKYCSLPLLHSIYVQLSIPLSDFRRIIGLCPNLVRLEIEIVDNGYSNEEIILVLTDHEHIHIRRFHIYNLFSFDIFDIYIKHLPNLENLYISMNFSSHPLDLFKQLSNLIDRIDHLKEFHFRFSTVFCNFDHQELEKLKELNSFFGNILIKNENDKFIFIR
jgi:hypothetical protein